MFLQGCYLYVGTVVTLLFLRFFALKVGTPSAAIVKWECTQETGAHSLV